MARAGSRVFNGTANFIVTSPGTLNGVPFTFGTVAAVIRRNAITGVFQEMVNLIGGGSTDWYFAFDASDHVVMSSHASTPTFTSTSDWLCLAVTKATGTALWRYHAYNYTTGVWTHGDLATTTANGAINLDTIGIGRFASNTEFLNANVAMAGYFRAWAPNDAAFETANLHMGRTGWITASSSGTGSAVWAFDQYTSTDFLIDILGGGADETSQTSSPATSTAQPPAPWADAPFTPTATLLGSTQTTTATGPPNTLAFSYTGTSKPAVGDSIVVCCARDNITNDPATGDSCTDGNSNTYTRVGALASPAVTSTAAAGEVGVMFEGRVTTAWSAGTNTVTWTATTAAASKAMTVLWVQNTGGVRPSSVGTGGGTAGVGSATTGAGTPQAYDLAIGMMAIEGSGTQAETLDSDTVNGIWSNPQTRAFSGSSSNATTALTHAKVITQKKLLTTAGAQTYNATNGNTSSVDVVAIVAAFMPVPADQPIFSAWRSRGVRTLLTR